MCAYTCMCQLQWKLFTVDLAGKILECYDISHKAWPLGEEACSPRKCWTSVLPKSAPETILGKMRSQSE